jgi:hypothetical protein
MRLKLISCEIFYREFCSVVARSPNTVDVEFLPKGLHDIGSEGMQARLQAALERVDDPRYEAVLLGYALCNNGVVGLTAGKYPLVIPRAHDCITLFLGSAGRYLDYFNSHPGVYFKTTGWMERGEAEGELMQLSVGKTLGVGQSYADLVARYGEDNAKYLWSELGDLTKNYSQFTYIEMGVGPDEIFEREAREEAAKRGWKYEKLAGDLGIFQRLVDGVWDEGEFLVVPPGRQVAADYSGGLISIKGLNDA